MKFELETLEQKRKEFGYSYNEISKRSGFSKSYVWQLFKGKRNLSYEHAIVLAKVFGKKPDELFYEQFVDEINKKTT